MPELAYLNGVFCPIADATVSIEDRGFQFGDGVYEVVVSHAGRPFQLEEHMQRLRLSAAAIGLEYDFDHAPLEPIIAEGMRRSELNDAMIYLQLTRGVAPREHAAPDSVRPTVVMTFKPRPVVPDEFRRRGARVITIPDTRWANCYIKAITLLPNTLAKTDALRRGYDDAIFVTRTGEVRECTAANVFVVHDGRLRTPPRTESILHGITQAFVLDCAAAAGVAGEEGTCTVEGLKRADEVFMSSTTTEILGITSIDDESVGDGQVGPVTKRLLREFRQRATPSPIT